MNEYKSYLTLQKPLLHFHLIFLQKILTLGAIWFFSPNNKEA